MADVRKEFEAWAKRNDFVLDEHPGCADAYDSDHTDDAWVGWQAGYQAARRAALEEAAKVCEDRSGFRGTGAWTCLQAAAEAIRALAAEAAQGKGE